PPASRPAGLDARQRPTLPLRYHSSTIGAGGLNFRVRNGNGCLPSAIVTERGDYSRVQWATAGLASPPAPCAEALDLSSLCRRDEVRAPAHLPHETLLLHLASEL